MTQPRLTSICLLSLFAVLGQSNLSLGQSNDPPPAQPAFGRLDEATAQQWAELVLAGVDTQFPNKLSLVYTDADQLKTPKENFPAFYGCFDWHSSVHGHWVLARLLRSHPNLDAAPEIRDVLSSHLTRENIKHETAFFAHDRHKSFERMYGWSWYLRLAMELDDWDDADARRWRENLRPLENLFVERIRDYLPLLTFPIRTGQHTDTGFALGQILDYARAMKLRDLEQLVIDRADAYYQTDIDYPVQYEPSGHDFFSSGWNEADLMRRVLKSNEFAAWFENFIPNLDERLRDGTIEPVAVSDLTDGKLVHLAGLNLSRAWCMRAIAMSLPAAHPHRDSLLQSASAHLSAGLAYVNSGHYEGDHWLATFALYALTQSGGERNE